MQGWSCGSAWCVRSGRSTRMCLQGRKSLNGLLHRAARARARIGNPFALKHHHFTTDEETQLATAEMQVQHDEPTPVVRMRGISKRFGGVVALDNVDLEAWSGEVLAIVGDNGAGKSTLIKVLTGVHQPSSGSIELEGVPFTMASHSDAIAAGVDAVYQNLAIADHLTPAENLFLGSELTRKVLGITVLDNKRMRQEAVSTLNDRLGVKLKSMDVLTESLSGGQRQAVAIARAVRHENLRLLVMDEPTAALGPQETARTLELIKSLRDQGLAVIVISHSLDDVFAISDRIHVQRRGRCVGVVKTAQTSSEEVLSLIVGAKSDVSEKS